MGTITFGTTSGNKFQDAVSHGAVSVSLSGAVYRSDGTSDDILLDPIDLGTANTAGYWRPGSKQSWTDQTANGNNGTATGVTLDNYGGIWGGGTNRVAVPDADSLDITSPYCVEAWVKPTLTGNYPELVGKDNSGSGSRWGWSLASDNSYKPNFFGGTSSAASANAPAAATWTHLAFSWDGTTWRHWKNGSINGNGASPTETAAANAVELVLGNRNGDYARPLTGIMDEIRLRTVAGYTAAFTPYRFPASASWGVVVDGGANSENWTNINFSAVTSDTGNYVGSISQISYRASNDSTFGGGSQAFTDVATPDAGDIAISVTGRYLEVKVFLTPESASGRRTLTPKLTGLTLTATDNALAAGTVSLTSKTATTANLSCTVATGGTSPYTYQWYRSTASGFTPGAGNILSGQTSLNLADTGLSAGTTYYYKIRVTDGIGSTADAAQLGVTTDSAPADGPLRHAMTFRGECRATGAFVV